MPGPPCRQRNQHNRNFILSMFRALWVPPIDTNVNARWLLVSVPCEMDFLSVLIMSWSSWNTARLRWKKVYATDRGVLLYRLCMSVQCSLQTAQCYVWLCVGHSWYPVILASALPPLFKATSKLHLTSLGIYIETHQDVVTTIAEKKTANQTENHWSKFIGIHLSCKRLKLKRILCLFKDNKLTPILWDVF